MKFYIGYLMAGEAISSSLICWREDLHGKFAPQIVQDGLAFESANHVLICVYVSI